MKHTIATGEPVVTFNQNEPIYPDDTSEIIPVTASPIDCEKYREDLAFMHEPVEIMFHLPHDPNDSALLVELTVNGEEEYFMKGDWKKTKRYFVEAAARMKRESWLFDYKKDDLGNPVHTRHAAQSLRYPFAVNDSNPKGQLWLQKVLLKPV